MAGALEARVKALEDALLYGGGGGTDSEEVARLRQAVARLTSEKTVGNVLGGMIRTEIGPGAMPIGPHKQDVDATYSLEFTLWIPDFWLRIKEAKVNLTPGPIRSSVTVAAAISSQTSDSGGGSTSGASSTSSSGASTSSSSGASTSSSSGASTASSTGSSTASSSGASSTSTTPSGGGSTSGSSSSSTTAAEGQTAVNVLTASHVHKWATFVGSGSGGGVAQKTSTFDSSGGTVGGFDLYVYSGSGDWYTGISSGGTVSVAPASHTHGMSHDHSTPNHQHNIDHTHDISHTHGIAHTHNIDHTHDIQHTHNIAHTHTTPNHQHTIPGHGHNLTLSIQEGGAATSMHLCIDGVDRTSDLGGPWSATVTGLDIRQYLINVRQEPVHGAHAIKVTSTSVGSAEVTGHLYGVLKAVA